MEQLDIINWIYNTLGIPKGTPIFVNFKNGKVYQVIISAQLTANQVTQLQNEFPNLTSVQQS